MGIALATSANNHFHIFCSNDWRGETHYVKDSTRQFIQIKCYKKYRSAEIAYADYAYVLTKNERTNIRFFGNARPDYKYWVKIVQEKEAPDNTNYTKRLTQLIKKYKLYQYDNMTIADLATEVSFIADELDPDLPLARSEREIITINRLPAIQTNIDDTPLVSETK